MPPDHLEERARSRLGTILRGKYRIDRVLGAGGMAVVYKATHRNQAEFAIKMLHPELSLSEDVRTRFLREGYAANSVKHSGAVRVVDDDVAEDGAAFLVMELLDGVACDTLLAQQGGRLPLGAACAIGVELLDVLATAHANGIVHRDIKPANLFLCKDGTLKVLDFGIARVRDTMAAGVHSTGTGGMLLGTPAFMAPEQALGATGDIDARADIWSVGATLFCMSTGEVVHAAENAQRMIITLATQQPRSLATLLPGAPAAVVSVVDRALSLEKERRWASAAAMRQGLEEARRSSWATTTPRAVIASLVAAYTSAHEGGRKREQATPTEAMPATPGRGPGESGTRPMGAAPTTPGPVVTPGSARPDSAPAVTPPQPSAPRRRAPARPAVFAAGALVALVAAGGVALLVRSTKQSVDGAAALVTPVAASESRRTLPSARETLASPPPLDDLSARALPPDLHASSTDRDAAFLAPRPSPPARPYVPTAARALPTGISTAGPASAKAATTAATASEPAPAPSQIPAAPMDPLDGRR
jgi:serine/threonine-protein kinase